MSSVTIFAVGILFTQQKSIIKVTTRKSSCVNARGIPTPRHIKYSISCSIPGGGGVGTLDGG